MTPPKLSAKVVKAVLAYQRALSVFFQTFQAHGSCSPEHRAARKEETRALSRLQGAIIETRAESPAQTKAAIAHRKKMAKLTRCPDCLGGEDAFTCHRCLGEGFVKKAAESPAPKRRKG